MNDDSVRMRCERCHRRMRHVVTVPYIGSWVEVHEAALREAA